MDLVIYPPDQYEEWDEDKVQEGLEETPPPPTPPPPTLPQLVGRGHSSDPVYSTYFDALQSTILYALTQWDSFMTRVTGLAVLDPQDTAPKGCLVRFVAFLSNPGASVAQVELRRSPTNQYSFWVYMAKTTQTEYVFADNAYQLHDLIFLLLILLAKWNVHKKASEHLQQFQLDTGIQSFRPQNWTSFEALLHHGLYLTSDRPRRYVSALGWSMDFVSGDHLIINHGGQFECEYMCSYRGAVGRFMDGSQHQWSCRNTPRNTWDTPNPCSLCHSHRMHSALNFISSYDLQTLIIQYKGD